MRMTHNQMIDVIRAHRDGNKIEYQLIGGDENWRPVVLDDPSWDFSACCYRIAPPALLDGQVLGWRPKGSTLPWQPVKGDVIGTTFYEYRPLNPHWPAVVWQPDGSFNITRMLFSDSADCHQLVGFVRLATEYPPVMLP